MKLREEVAAHERQDGNRREEDRKSHPHDLSGMRERKGEAAVIEKLEAARQSPLFRLGAAVREQGER